MTAESEKARLRLIFTKRLASLSASRRKDAAHHAFLFLRSFSQSFRYIFSFSPFRGEIDLSETNTFFLSQKKLALPKVEGQHLRFYRVNNLELIPHPWGMLEPDPNTAEPIEPTNQDLLLAPGLAFDQHHHRLGYGLGFYDRFLTDHQKYLWAAGIGFTKQWTPNLPSTKHDLSTKELFLF